MNRIIKSWALKKLYFVLYMYEWQYQRKFYQLRKTFDVIRLSQMILCLVYIRYFHWNNEAAITVKKNHYNILMWRCRKHWLFFHPNMLRWMTLLTRTTWYYRHCILAYLPWLSFFNLNIIKHSDEFLSPKCNLLFTSVLDQNQNHL